MTEMKSAAYSIALPGLLIATLLAGTFLLTSQLYLTPMAEMALLIFSSLICAVAAYRIIKNIRPRFPAVLSNGHRLLFGGVVVLLLAVIGGGIFVSRLASRSAGIFTSYEGKIVVDRPDMNFYVYRTGFSDISFSFTSLRYSRGMEFVSHDIPGLQLGNASRDELVINGEDSCVFIEGPNTSYRYFPATHRLQEIIPLNMNGK
jgi:hypothetical protein